MNVHDIVIEYLKANGYDGLCEVGCECACELSDLFPCGGDMADISHCQPGHKTPCPDDCELGGDCSWHIKPGKRGSDEDQGKHTEAEEDTGTRGGSADQTNGRELD